MIRLRLYFLVGTPQWGCFLFLSAEESFQEVYDVSLPHYCDINFDHLVKVVSAKFLHSEFTVINK